MDTSDVKRQFLACLRTIYRPPGTSVAQWRRAIDAREHSRERLHTLIDQLWGCWDRMPAWVCRTLRLGQHSTYHDAAIRLSLSRLDDLNDPHFINALVALFQQDYRARHPESAETPISPHTFVFVSWLRTYLPGEAEEVLKEYFSTPPHDPF
jgi:hypothetical protein